VPLLSALGRVCVFTPSNVARRMDSSEEPSYVERARASYAQHNPRSGSYQMVADRSTFSSSSSTESTPTVLKHRIPPHLPYAPPPPDVYRAAHTAKSSWDAPSGERREGRRVDERSQAVVSLVEWVFQ
jgi:hypothetical protein